MDGTISMKEATMAKRQINTNGAEISQPVSLPDVEKLKNTWDRDRFKSALELAKACGLPLSDEDHERLVLEFYFAPDVDYIDRAIRRWHKKANENPVEALLRQNGVENSEELAEQVCEVVMREC